MQPDTPVSMIFILIGTLLIMSVVFLIALAGAVLARYPVCNLFNWLILFSGISIAVIIHVLSNQLSP